MKAAMFTGFFAFVLGLVVTKGLKAVLARMKMNQIIREQGPEAHQKKSGTLTMGGIGFFITVPIALAAVWLFFPSSGFDIVSKNIAVVLAVSGVCFLIGFIDDYAKFRGKKTEGLKARYKIVIEFLLAAGISYYVIRYGEAPKMIVMPFGLGDISAGWLFIPFIIIVFSGTINAVNFTDGLDGLLGGCTLIICAAYSIYIVRAGSASDRNMLPVLFALAGSVAAFLWFNSHPASIFMGDTGSLFIGGLLASVAILTRTELFLFVAGILLVAEVMSVVLQVASFRLTKKRIFKMAPIHHHFELSGWVETQVVFRFYLITGICCALALVMFLR